MMTPFHSEPAHPSWDRTAHPGSTALHGLGPMQQYLYNVSPTFTQSEALSVDLEQLLDSSYCLPLLQPHYAGGYPNEIVSVSPSASTSPLPFPHLVASKVVPLQPTPTSLSPETPLFTIPVQQHDTSLLDCGFSQPHLSPHASVNCTGSPASPASKPSSAPKRTITPDANSSARFRPTKQQIDWLRNKFDENPSPKSDELRRMSQESGVEVQKLRVWFQNRRTRSKTTAA
ncbi:hypothetical protein BC830DRAFT_1145634 [Chytriomyces sp. MP71]|nr:hypothetical protein BC830DRAFT_1145634 [Chytriomyces sp. MP71]